MINTEIQRHISADTITLTAREFEILGMIYAGGTNKQVADLLFISKRTVDFHLENIYDKLMVSNRISACRRAIQLGLMNPTQAF